MNIKSLVLFGLLSLPVQAQWVNTVNGVVQHNIPLYFCTGLMENSDFHDYMWDSPNIDFYGQMQDAYNFYYQQNLRVFENDKVLMENTFEYSKNKKYKLEELKGAIELCKSQYQTNEAQALMNVED